MAALKLFISYSHKDEDDVNEFKKHTSHLVDRGLIETWYDRKILAGQDHQDEIANNLEEADIICLFVSANFMASSACKEEKARAQTLKTEKGVVVIPVILSACPWLDDEFLSPPLALPLDGHPVNTFSNSSDAWYDVYQGLKSRVEKEIAMRDVKLKEEFVDFLETAEMLSKAHPNKEAVTLDDIYVSPELWKYDELREFERDQNADELLRYFVSYSKVLVAGENQSGKTTLCKRLFLSLRKKNYFPVYVSDRGGKFLGKIENKIADAFTEQYEQISIKDIDSERLVPIVDDFHFAKHKDRLVQSLSGYKHQLIIVDDIFGLNVKDETIIQSHTHFKIKELHPSRRHSLIEKWLLLTEDNVNGTPNLRYKNIDKTTELVNTSLGRVIGSGIMPAYPFFVLSVISVNEAFGSSLDQDITSQGYCYQALIYLYLRKEGVKNEEVDTYLNFLTEYAFFIYKTHKREVPERDFSSFMEQYLNTYNLPINKDVLLDRFQVTQLLVKDSFGNYAFRYPYLYYFFVAKYLSDHIADNKDLIDSIIGNLHKDENSYIAIFISHHSREDYVLDEITLNACELFESHAVATLGKEELKFLDEQLDDIVEEVLPDASGTPEKERSRRLEMQDEADDLAREREEATEQDDDEVARELRRSLKTVEVMGRIIKNRAGSLKRGRLEEIFEEAMNAHLRILSSFFGLVKDEERDVVEFLEGRLESILEDRSKRREVEGKKRRAPDKEELEKLATKLFWNLNFLFILSWINKIVNYLGSDKLIDVVEKVCDKHGSPAAFLVKHGILMWYDKNVRVDSLVEGVSNPQMSDTAKRVLRFMVVNHCSLHHVNFKERQRISTKLGISSNRLFGEQTRKG